MSFSECFNVLYDHDVFFPMIHGKKKEKKKVEILDRLPYITEKGIYPVSNKYINEGCKVEGALTMQESMMKIFACRHIWHEGNSLL